MAENEDQEIALPDNYAQFNTFTPKSDDSWDESVNLPKVYLKCPMFANTVIFSMSDIEKLEGEPKLIDDYLKDVKNDLNQAYEAIKAEDLED